MCDYSLMAVPNRLAREGEELVFFRFPTGSLGLASPADVKRAVCRPPASRTFLERLKNFFAPPQTHPVCAVCIPPGARLRLLELHPRLQRQYNVDADVTVTFTQITAAVHSYRDAVRFPDGREVRLQDLYEGMRVRVADLSLAEELDLDTLRRERAEFPVRY
ncbi:MAG: hypothetical protein JST11_23970 [Acidobacteria bacterium]|nr:hypothetical protein [Acidobacteriota bacterium]